jgi:hypothetical protein
MSTRVRDDIFVLFVFDDKYPTVLNAEVYYGVTKEVLDRFRDQEGQFSSAAFRETVKNLPPAWLEMGPLNEIFQKVVTRLTQISLGNEIQSKVEDLRLVRVAFHQIHLKPDKLKQAFVMAYYQLIDGAIERVQRRQRQQQLPASLTYAAHTGYFKEIGEGGVNMARTVHLWVKPLNIWFIDESEPHQWAVSLDESHETPEGPPV